MRHLIYDCEIIRCIPDRDGSKPEPDLEYCDGWDDHKNMGLAVIGWETSLGDRGICVWENASDREFFQSLLNQFPLIIGFNSRNFDDNLLAANGVKIATGYDLLEEIRIAAYGSPAWNDQPRGYSYSLGAIAQANGAAKTGTGDLAPVLWQLGKRQQVIDYCLNDVALTQRLLMLGLSGDLIDPNTGKKLRLRPLPAEPASAE